MRSYVDKLCTEIEAELRRTPAFIDFYEGFSSSLVEALAHESKFVCRKTNRLSGVAFLQCQSHYLCNSSETERTLSDQCEYLEEAFGIAIGVAAYEAKFTPQAVSFLERCYQHLITSFVEKLPCPELSGMPFEGIHVTDATSFQLPASLSAHFAGSKSTTGVRSLLKIFFQYDLLHSASQQLRIAQGYENDTQFWDGQTFEPGHLYVQDLGFFSQEVYEQMAQSGAYFLSRYKTNVNLYTKDTDNIFHKLDLQAYLEQVSSSSAQTLNVYVGEKTKTPFRLLLQPVPEHVKKDRLKKMGDQYSKKNGKMVRVSAFRKFLAGFNLFITNTHEDQLTAQQALDLYKLWWQIELVFKVWKSLFHIHKVGKMDFHRLMCYLYGHLIAILLCTATTTFIQRYVLSKLSADQEIYEISMWKACKIIKKSSNTIG